MTRAPRVSVVIPAYYSDNTFPACLVALRAQTFRDFETIVVNSSPEQRTRAIVGRGFPDVRFEQSAQRLLPHAARNRGVAIANGELLAFTDPDCIAAPDWLARLVEAHDAGHGVVGGSMALASDAWFERGVHLCKFFWVLGGLPPGPLPIVPTANACYTRAAWRAAGPFRGDRFTADALLSWRAWVRGYAPWFEPRAIVAHRHPGTLATFWLERYARGREFAELRMEFERWSRRRALAYAAAAPLLVAVVLARAARAAFASGWGGSFVVTLPVQAAGHLAWSLGEQRKQWAYAWRVAPLVSAAR